MPDNSDDTTKPLNYSQIPIVTYTLAILCVLVSLANWTTSLSPIFQRISVLTTFSNEQIWDGAFYGLFTAFFAHGNFAHLVFNILFVVLLGRTIEPVMPRAVYLLFMILAAGITAGCELGIVGLTAIGASGVGCAMFGLMWAGQARFESWRTIATNQNMGLVLIGLLLCVVVSALKIVPVANIAHFSGILFGVCMGKLWAAPKQRPFFLAVLLLLALVPTICLFWMPWSPKRTHYLANKAYDAKDYERAISLYHKSLRLGGKRFRNWDAIKNAWAHIAANAAARGDLKAENEAIANMVYAARQEGESPYIKDAKTTP